MIFSSLSFSRRLLLTALLFGLGFSVQAQLTESFESASAPPANWNMLYEDSTPTLGIYNNEMMHVNPDNPNQQPYTNPPYDSAYAGSQVFRFSSNSTDPDKDYYQYLITPPLNVTPANDSVAFYYRPNIYYGDKFRIGWSTTTNDTSAFTFGPVKTVQDGDDTLWNLHYKNDLPLNTKYVCIKYGKPDNQGYMLYIDGFYGPPASSLDASILDFKEPTYPGNSNLLIDFANTGLTTLTNLTIDYEIDGVPQSQVSWSGSVAQDSVKTDFNLGTYNFSQGSHTVKIWLSSPNGGTDVDHLNDTLYSTFVTANDPVANAGGNADICAGETYTVNTASASSYDSIAWSTSGTGSFVNGNTLMPTYIPSPTDTTNGSVTLTLTAFGYPGHPDDNSQMTLTIHQTPVVSFSGLQAEYCLNDPNVTLTGSPGAGTFSGSGIVNGNEFSPALAGPGNHTILYSYTNSYGCSNSTTQNVKVNSLPVVSLNGLDSEYCKENINDTLTGLPYGGTFSGQGMTDSVFNPGSLVGGNNYNITYSYTDANGCTGAITQSTLVRALPSLSFSGLKQDYCDDESSSTLTPNTTGGTFSGPGVSGNSFDPMTAGTGTHTVSYSYTDTYGCSNTVDQNTTVNSTPSVSFSGLASSYCADDPTVTLTGNPSGGTFSGTAMNGNQFSPKSAGPGTYSINYSYTTPAGCGDDQTQIVTVNSLPDATFSGLASAYCEDEPVDTLIPSVSGGFFLGKGVNQDSLFNPAAPGPGTYEVSYWVFASNGCFDSTIQQVNINPKPDANIFGLANAYCEDVPDVTLTGVPSGGNFNGTGMSGNVFSPGNAGGGKHQITYSITNSYGCADIKKRSVQVDTIPKVSFSGLDSSYCADSPADTLHGMPAISGGVFLGKGMTDSLFYPSDAQAGNSKIIYHVTTSAGCVNADTQFVKVKPLPDVYLGMDTVICVDDSIQLTDLNQAADLYSWSTGDSLDTISVVVEQDSSITITGTLNGCTNSDKINIEMSDPRVNLGKDTTVCAKESITLDAGPGFATYLWSNGKTTRKITLDSTGIGLDSVDISVVVVNDHGCQAKDTINIDFDICHGIENYAQSEHVIYPNPGNGLLTIEGDLSPNDIIYIYNSHGAFISSFEVNNEAMRKQIDLRDLRQGIYYLVLRKEKATFTRKIIITR